jgi:hypothetical protein
MREHTALLAVLALLSPALSKADTLREQCLARVDALHSCACNDIRADQVQDPAAFDLARPDLQAVYQGMKSSPHYQAEADGRLVAALKSAYTEQRELLACHDRVGVRTGNFVLAEEYCVREEGAAREQGKPLCRSVTPAAAEQASRVVLERADKFLGTFDQELARMSYCPAAPLKPILNSQVVAVEIPPCRIDLKSLFPDNRSVLTEEQVRKIVAHVQGHACYQQYLRNGLALRKVEIQSSSSLLANTGAAANKSFLQLSEERADEIESKIVRAIVDPSILNRVQYEKNAHGQNGDGTSGSCPYAYDARRGNWLRKTFPTAAQLEASKRTELNFYFSEQVKTVESAAHADLMALSCKRVQFYCR